MTTKIWSRLALRDRLGFVALVAIATWMGREHSTPDGPPTLWYRGGRVFGIPMQYVVLAAVVAVLIPFVRSRTMPFPIEKTMRYLKMFGWLIAGGIAILISFSGALVGDANNLFIDWRNIAVVMAVTWAATRWLGGREWAGIMLLDLAVVYGLLSIGPLFGFAFGRGSVSLGTTIAIFSSEILTLSAFGAIVTTAVWVFGLNSFPRWYAHLVIAASVLSSLLVALSFRRGYWLIWVLGVGTVSLLGVRRAGVQRAAVPLAMASIVIIGSVIAFGTGNLALRLASFDPDADARTNAFAATTSDHVNDIADAMDVIWASPITGLGMGVTYQTNRISAWKTESFVVHSAPVHVWLKFGVLGLIAYLGFHYAWIRASFRRLDSVVSSVVMTATGVFVASEIVATLFATWPYGRFQVSIHHGILLAALLVVTAQHFEPAPLQSDRDALPA